MQNQKRAAYPSFEDYSEVYFADACVPLEEAAASGEVALEALVRGDYPGTALDDGVVDGVRTVGFWDASRPQGWGLDWHRNEGIEISFLERGTLGFATRDSSWDLRAGQFTVTRPWQEHRVGRPNLDASLLHWIIIDVDVRRPHQHWKWPSWIGLSTSDLARLTRLLQHNENPVWWGTPAFETAFRGLKRAVVNPTSPTVDSELRLFTGQMLLALLQILDEQPQVADHALTSPRRAVEMFLQELDDHLGHPWTLPEMGRACGLGRSQFSEYCHQITNMSPVEFMTFRRLERAANCLVTQTSRSITDISTECGFQSSQYFATTFRRRFDVSPSDFRARSLEDAVGHELLLDGGFTAVA